MSHLRQSTFVRHSPLPPVMVQWSAQLSAVPPLPLSVVLGPRRTLRSLIVGAAKVVAGPFLLPHHLSQLRPWQLLSQEEQSFVTVGQSFVTQSRLRPVAAQKTAHLSADPPLPCLVVLGPRRLLRSLIVGAANVVAGPLPGVTVLLAPRGVVLLLTLRPRGLLSHVIMRQSPMRHRGPTPRFPPQPTSHWLHPTTQLTQQARSPSRRLILLRPC